jgi:uracil-DNA glycosylase
MSFKDLIQKAHQKGLGTLSEKSSQPNDPLTILPSARRLTIHRKKVNEFELYRNLWDSCKACNLCNFAKQKVHCRGHLPAQVLFIGESPGEGEDETGVPFVGPCGDVLDAVIMDSIDVHNLSLPQKQQLKYCITNAVLCHPDEPNKPTRDELKACSDRLYHFLSICNPELIIIVGEIAEKAWMMQLAKHIMPRSIKIYHPGYMLRQQNDPEKGQNALQLEINRASTSILSALRENFPL